MKNRNRKPFLLIFGLGMAAIFLLVFLLNQSSNQTALQGDSVPPDGVPRVSIAETRRALDAGDAVVMDVRSRFNYEEGHIPGSINAPLTSDTFYRVNTPSDSLIYLYCT